MKHDLPRYRSRLISLLETHFDPDLIGLVHYLDEVIGVPTKVHHYDEDHYTTPADDASRVERKKRVAQALLRASQETGEFGPIPKLGPQPSTALLKTQRYPRLRQWLSYFGR